MLAPVLIAYTTKSGSTGEIAKVIGEVLEEACLPVEVLRMRNVKWQAQRTAVILGAPLYMGALPGELHGFLRRNKVYLSQLSPWLFVLGPIEGKTEEFAFSQKQAEKQLARYPWLKPAELKILSGKFDVNRMPFPFNLARYLPAFPAKNMPAKDARNWDEIRAWAAAIAREILPAA